MAILLIVDDSKFTRNQIVKTLAEEGYEIWEAENGQRALELIKTQKPDCIITDLLMPVMDGATLIKRLKDENLEIPAIVITADIQEDTKKMCMTLGAREVINKPPKEGQLKKAVQNALTSKVN